MFPSKKQWSNWSLPSKLTAIGTYVTIFGLFITLISALDGFTKSDMRAESNQQPTPNSLAKKIMEPGVEGLFVGQEMLCGPRDVCRDKTLFLPKLVLVAENAPVFRSTKSEEFVSGVTLKPFQPLFVLSTKQDNSGNRWLKLGSSQSDAIGWIHSSSAFLYENRLSLRIIPEKDLLVPAFSSLEVAQDYVQKNNLVDEGEVEWLESVAAADSSSTAFLPVLASDRILGHHRRRVTLVKTRFNKDLTKLLPSDCGECEFWIPDRLESPKRLFEPEVLITQKELDAYVSTAKTLIEHYERSEIAEPAEFVEALHELFFLVTQFSSIASSPRSELDYEFVVSSLQNLPYGTASSMISSDNFLAMGGSGRLELIEAMRRKLAMLEASDHPNLNQGAPEGYEIYLLPLHYFL